MQTFVHANMRLVGNMETTNYTSDVIPEREKDDGTETEWEEVNEEEEEEEVLDDLDDLDELDDGDLDWDEDGDTDSEDDGAPVRPIYREEGESPP
jgi:phosphopantothenoylcysteine synthetase/decarboxylase